jgi:hypothetical protein
MSYTQDQNFVFLNGVKNQIRIAPNRDHPNAGLILRMAHVGKAAELRGDLANASDNLAGRYWIVKMASSSASAGLVNLTFMLGGI